MSSADQPDIGTDVRRPAHLSAVRASPEQRESHDWWPGTDPYDAVPPPPAGQPGHGSTTSLWRQSAWITDDHTGHYTDLFEVICPSCGDHPDLDYSEVSSWLQRLRGPRAIKEGLAVYIEHIGGWPPA